MAQDGVQTDNIAKGSKQYSILIVMIYRKRYYRRRVQEFLCNFFGVISFIITNETVLSLNLI